MTLDPANWLDIMPPIPLARGVPVVTKTHSLRAVAAYVDDTGTVLADRYAMDQAPGSAYRWRVDLEDPQGFAYALRHLWLRRSNGMACLPNESHPEFWMHARHAVGQTTTADRVALAQALAELAP